MRRSASHQRYATLFCAQYHEQLSKHVHLAVPELKALRLAHGKSGLPRIANEAGVEVPRTFNPQDDEELREISEQINYPCVVKPRRGESAVGVWYATSAKDLRTRYHDSPFRSDAVYDFSRPVIQEYISGPTHDACLLFDNGEPIAASTQRRIKTYPIEGGKGIVCETTDDPQVKEQAIKLLRRLDWHGPAQVEFKLIPENRLPMLIEINGRFWGTLDLAIQAGIDFPGLTCRLAVGQNVEPHFDYQVGLKYRWIVPHELVHFLFSSNKWRNLPGLFQLNRRTRCDISFADPFPFPAHLAGYIARALKRGAARINNSSVGPHSV